MVERAAGTRLGDRRWPYAVLAAFSVVTVPFTFAFTLMLGILVGVLGSLRAAVAYEDVGWRQGLHLFFAGLALLAGPFIVLVLLVAGALPM